MPLFFPLALAQLEGFAPVFAMLALFSPIILLILSRHQQKMAIIMRQGQPLPPQTDPRVLEEIAALRELVHQQMLMVDDLSRQQQLLMKRDATDDVRSRLDQISR